MRLKEPALGRNFCSRCNRMMSNYDLHPLCRLCRGMPCDGEKVSCQTCYAWSPYQRQALSWALRNAEKLAKKPPKKPKPSANPKGEQEEDCHICCAQGP